MLQEAQEEATLLGKQGVFGFLATWQNFDPRTQNQVHSHVLLQMQGWGMKIETKKFWLPYRPFSFAQAL